MDILKVYPSGKVTASRRKKFNLDASFRGCELTEEQEWNLGQMKSHGIESAIASKKGFDSRESDRKIALNQERAIAASADDREFYHRQIYLYGFEAATEARRLALAPLGLSSVPNLSTHAESLIPSLKRQRGSGGITSKSRQQVKDGATLLEKKYGREQLSFVTHTIPAPFVVDVHANWVKILANLRRRYIRMLQKARLPQDLIMVSEYQEERLEKTGQAVLHLHIVFVGRRRKRHWQYEVEHYKEHWRECCEEYIKERRDKREWNAATRVESIRKSCANYLGKYMSKGTTTLASVLAADVDAFIPSSWHILSQKMRVAIRKATRFYEGAKASEIFDFIVSNAKELLRFNRYIKIPTQDGKGLVVGWYGDLRDKSLFD